MIRFQQQCLTAKIMQKKMMRMMKPNGGNFGDGLTATLRTRKNKRSNRKLILQVMKPVMLVLLHNPKQQLLQNNQLRYS